MIIKLEIADTPSRKAIMAGLAENGYKTWKEVEDTSMQPTLALDYIPKQYVCLEIQDSEIGDKNA